MKTKENKQTRALKRIKAMEDRFLITPSETKTFLTKNGKIYYV